MSKTGLYWRIVLALAVLATALVWNFFTGHVPWTRAMLYGMGAGAIVAGFGVLFDDLAWWGVRLVRVIKRGLPPRE